MNTIHSEPVTWSRVVATSVEGHETYPIPLLHLYYSLHMLETRTRDSSLCHVVLVVLVVVVAGRVAWARGLIF